MKRLAPAIAMVGVVGISCSSVVGPTLSDPADTTTSAAPLAATSSETIAVPSSIGEEPLLVPAPYDSAETLAEDISRIEVALRSTVDAADLGELAHRQQRAYRQLSYMPEWHEIVLGTVEPAVAGVVQVNLDSRLEFLGMQTRYADRLPDWTIIEPEPADALLSYYTAAEDATGIEWEYLAAINLVETGMGRISGVSSANAQGPMQFLPTTWDEAGIGAGDINDPHDAIQAAARYLVRRGGPADMQKALFGYNNHVNYVAAVTNYADLMRQDVAAYYAFHAWEIYFLTVAGDLWLPVGYSETERIPVAEWIAANPGIATTRDGSLNYVLGGRRPADAPTGPSDCAVGAGTVLVGIPGFCMIVSVNAEVVIDNRSSAPFALDIAAGALQVSAQSVQQMGITFGERFQVGYHQLEPAGEVPDVTNIWVFDPADSPFANEELTLRSFAGLRPGESTATSTEIAGSSIELADDASAGCFIGSATDDPYAPRLLFLSGTDDSSDAVLARIDIFDPGVSTPSGIHVGSTEAELSSTYGSRLETRPHTFADGSYVYFVPQSADDANYRIGFEVIGGVVVSMWNATLDAAYLVDGCA